MNAASNRIDTRFARLASEQRKALIPFVTAGFPTPEVTVPLMHAMVAAGADLIELGVPFSDPMADGPTIQRASEQALANGQTLAKTLAMVEAFRAQDRETPVVLMGYLNPIEAMGWTRFVSEAARVGVDGVLTVDLPPQEAHEPARQLRAAGIAPIFLLAPTSPETRARVVGELGRGYVYYVSLTGVTGAGHLDVAAVTERLEALRQWVTLPIAVGFGVKDAQSAQAIAKVADAVVVGSRLIEAIDADPANAIAAVTELLTTLRAAVDTVAATAEPRGSEKGNE
ncbi:tryptophan synthase alpha chain [Hydrogenophilus thermoluteolus]|uniref:tryptophan synthase subunit alpha n=1 Tax=Hydrogenophilus thermoluteolus TaxID=297 RepID=UPI0024A03283|nr:tryptophan synthase subunit alpha [Hydrogenophilus thermoluteolus]GLW59712.1 tryptophan synthase alpha chain [Hydrogenophilus thermoluteolus]